jgi:hypothetical protein
VLTRGRSIPVYRRHLFVTTAIAAAGIVALAATIPSEGFYSGDAGLKLIAAENALNHPTRPFEIDLPLLGGRPFRYVDPMVALHQGHGDVLQSPLFPLLTAPLIAAFGLRGAYALPALAFVALLPLLEVVRRCATPNSSFALLAFIAVAANPLFFYSLEFWEHSVAVALLAAGVAAAFIGCHSARARWIVASGALASLAALLRPEAVWFVVGLAVVIGRGYSVAFGCGAAAIIIPFVGANLAHSGTLLGLHAAANLAPLSGDYGGARWQRFTAWFQPGSPLASLGLLLVTAAWVGRIVNMDLRVRQSFALVGALAVAVAASQRLVPHDSTWQAFPLSLLALIPTTTPTSGARRMWVVVIISIAGIILTATHDGGAQWGARFLLVTAPLLMVLGASGATDAMHAGRWHAIRIVLVVAVLIAGALTSRSAYQELRGAKRAYARLVHETASLTAAGDIIVTNVWWFDQITAPLYRSRIFLFTPDLVSTSTALTDLSKAGVSRLKLVWSSDGPTSPDDALHGSCFQLLGVRDIPEHRLRIASAQCRAD